MGNDIGIGGEEKRRLWEKRLREWRSSGLSRSAYCRRVGVSVKSFGYWKKKLAGDNDRLSLVELPRLSAFYHPSRPLCLEVGGLYRIAIEPGFDADTLHALLQVLAR